MWFATTMSLLIECLALELRGPLSSALLFAAPQKPQGFRHQLSPHIALQQNKSFEARPHAFNMASPELSARLRFFNESAHLLATTAPATSRQLISRCNALMTDNEPDTSEAQRLNACGACGTIMIVGWEGTKKMESQPARRGKGPRDGQAVKHTKALVYHCETCGKKTQSPLGTKLQAYRQNLTTSGLRSNITSQSITKPSPASSAPEAKSSSKKRAKAKKRGGLEAILAAKKAGEYSGFGLDLMDFMKKS